MGERERHELCLWASTLAQRTHIYYKQASGINQNQTAQDRASREPRWPPEGTDSGMTRKTPNVSAKRHLGQRELNFQANFQVPEVWIKRSNWVAISFSRGSS